MYLPSNGATANVAHRDLDLNLQAHDFVIVNISIYQRISQMTIDSRKISRDFQTGVFGNMQIYHFPRILLPFPPFPDGVENTYSQFSRKLFY